MVDSTVMLKLGDFKFSISTAAYVDLERSNDWRWAKIERIGVAPARQYVGPGDDMITMRGTIYPHFALQRQGLQQLPALRAQADRGVPLALVDGNGRVWGDYVIESLKEAQKTFFSDGTPRCIEFDLSLASYGEHNPSIGLAAVPEPATAEVVQRADIQSQVADLS